MENTNNETLQSHNTTGKSGSEFSGTESETETQTEETEFEKGVTAGYQETINDIKKEKEETEVKSFYESNMTALDIELAQMDKEDFEEEVEE